MDENFNSKEEKKYCTNLFRILSRMQIKAQHENTSIDMYTFEKLRHFRKKCISVQIINLGNMHVWIASLKGYKFKSAKKIKEILTRNHTYSAYSGSFKSKTGKSTVMLIQHSNKDTINDSKNIVTFLTDDIDRIIW